MTNSQVHQTVKPAKTIRKTIDLYTIEQLEKISPQAYERAIYSEIDRNREGWFEWGERDAFHSALEAENEPGLWILEWDEERAWLLLNGFMNTTEEIRVARALEGKEQIDEVQVGKFRDWTGWQYFVSNDDWELTDEEGEKLLQRKKMLEKAIASDVKSAYLEVTSEEYAYSTASERKALFQICGTEYEE